jgi:hypothetical protein
MCHGGDAELDVNKLLEYKMVNEAAQSVDPISSSD